MQSIPPEGPLDAKIALIGESGGKTEWQLKSPFRGASGLLLEKWWSYPFINLKRNEIYIDNVYPYLPPKTRYSERVSAMDKVGRKEVMHNITLLRGRLAKLQNVSVIVPVGNYALYALTGRGKCRGLVNDTGITDLRGSLLSDYDGRKVIPTIHPANLIHSRQDKNEMKRVVSLEKRTVVDWQKIAYESKFPEIRKPGRETNANPSRETVRKLIEYAKNPNHKLAVDIEKWGKNISCIGFAIHNRKAIVFPLVTKEDKKEYREAVNIILSSPCQKIFAGGLYDVFVLEYNEGFFVNNYIWDVIYMHHCLDSCDEHRLGYVASLYCDGYTYWKDMVKHKDAGKLIESGYKLHILWAYNGLDCMYTYELQEKLYEQLKNRGRLGFYKRHYSELLGPINLISKTGVPVDLEAQEEKRDKLLEEIGKIRHEVGEIAGEDLFSDKQWSRNKLLEYFYGEKALSESTINSRKNKKDWVQRYDKEQDRWIKTDRNSGEEVVKKSKGAYKNIPTEDEANDVLQGIKSLDLPLPRKKRGIKGVSLDEFELKKLGMRHEEAVPVVSLILKARKNKKISEYFDRNSVDKDGFMRSSYSFLTEMGRLQSDKNPNSTGRNAQNIDRKIRDTYVALDGYIMMELDLSQAESRIAKMYTGSERMRELANMRPDKLDVHRLNTSNIFGIKEENVSADLRFIGKTAVHAAEGGQQGYGLSQVLLKHGYVYTREQCQSMIDRYFEANPEYHELYFPYVRQQLLNRRILMNSWGRVWDVRHELFSDDLYRRAYRYYLQSECIDWINQLGLKPIHRYIMESNLEEDCKICLHCHDSLLFMVKPKVAFYIMKEFVRNVETPRIIRGGKLVMPATVKVGKSWAGGKEWKVIPSRGEFDEYIKTI